MITKRNWQFWIFIFLSWITFPLMAIWLMLTHPGKCAKVWKMEICGIWFEPNKPLNSTQGKENYGKDISLDDLCRTEPEWAANRIRVLIKEAKELKSIIGTIRQRR